MPQIIAIMNSYVARIKGVGGGAITPPTDELLLETGDFVLLETGDKILLESNP